MIKGYCMQTGKIDKFIVFCLVQGKNGCVSREKWGTMPPPPPPSSMEWPFWTTVIKTSMLGMVYLDLTACPLLLGY